MLFFLCDQNGSFLYLLNNKQYTVGRKDCDINISNDQSISRKHALLTVKDNKVILCDQSSRYNTFVDDAKIEAETEIILTHGNVIRFGRLQSIYIFNERDIITTTSSIKRQQKATLTSNINYLGGFLIQNWNIQCTHVTVEEILLTVKVLCAIISGIPIVKLKFWDDYVDCVKKNLPAPDCKNYLPPCSEMLLNYQNISLKYKEERKRLFKNKIFIFATEEEKSRMEDMIKLAGGEVMSFENNPITKSVIKNSFKEYLVMVSESSSINPLQNIVNYIHEQGKRTIPLQEIALAIITCSCEKDCNPSFDRKGTVFQAKTQTQKQMGNILATETQSQNLLSVDTHSVKIETIISPSIMEFTSTQNEINQESLISSKIEETITSVKREGESMDDVHDAKKIKIEVPSVFTRNTQKKDMKNSSEITLESVVKEKDKPTGKSLFAFKNDKNKNENIASESRHVINPFAKKRKATQNNENENQPKKTALFSDLMNSPTPSTSKSSAPLINESPFANILKSKSSQISSQNFPPKPVAKKIRNIASSTVINNKTSDFNVDLSAIEKVDSTLEKSYGWISKSSCNDSGERLITNIIESINIIDDNILNYIESFKNSVVIEEEPLVVKTTVKDNNNDSSVVNHNMKNYKNFKKVKPLNIQTTIISESKYQNVVCNDKSAMPVEDSENSEDESDIDSQVNTVKRKGKRFDF